MYNYLQQTCSLCNFYRPDCGRDCNKKLSWTDLIPWRRTAHYHLNRLALVLSLPDGVHIRKTMKCSYRPRWGMSNLVLIRTLRNSIVTLVRFMIQAKKVSLLDFVRNKDRRAVEPIVRLTRPKVLDFLSGLASFVTIGCMRLTRRCGKICSRYLFLV